MPSPVFKINPRLEAELLASPIAQAISSVVAEQLASRAAALAPYERIGAQIDHEVALVGGRWQARVNANDWISHFWEFGTINHPARAFMRPAAAQLDSGIFQATR